MAQAVCEQGAEEGTRNEQRDDVLTNQVILGGGHIVHAEFLFEGVEGHRCPDKGTRISDHVGTA